MKVLDFVVIGASKSGTTSLFHYLREHPGISLPDDKDAPFFAIDDWYEQGWQRFAGEFFRGAPPDTLWGTVTPRYMEDARVPARMSRLTPQIKLIAILRNPVDRFLSQYRQQVRRGKEPRSLEEVVTQILDPMSGPRIDPEATGTDTPERYLAPGEYGRVLRNFRSFFARERMHVIFSEELDRDPATTFDSLLSFLGLARGFRPQNLGRRYHVGGRERFPWLIPAVKRVAPLRWLWHTLPRARRRSLWFRFFTQMNVVPESRMGLSPEQRQALVAAYAPDVGRLSELLGLAVPWPEFASGNGCRMGSVPSQCDDRWGPEG